MQRNKNYLPVVAGLFYCSVVPLPIPKRRCMRTYITTKGGGLADRSMPFFQVWNILKCPLHENFLEENKIQT